MPEVGKIELTQTRMADFPGPNLQMKLQLDRIEKKLDALLEDAGIGDDAKDKGID